MFSAAVFLVLAIAVSFANRAAADEPLRVVVLTDPSMDGADCDQLVQTLKAHLSGLEVVVIEGSVELGGGLDGRTEQLRKGARAYDSQLALWVAPDGSEIVVVEAKGESGTKSMSISVTREGWGAQCAALGSMALSLVEPFAKDQDRDAPKRPRIIDGGESKAANPEEEAPGPSLESTPAEGRLWRIALSTRLGLDVPSSRLDPFVVVGVGWELILPPLQRRLSVGLDFTYTQPSHRGSGSDDRVGAYTYENTVLELKVGLDVYYRFLGERHLLSPYVGIGPVLQYLRTTQTTSIGGGVNAERNLEFGGEIAGGLDLRVGAGGILIDARFVITALDHRFTGKTNAGNGMFTVGYRIVF